MNNLRLIPDTHRQQEIIKASIAYDKKLIGNPNRKQYSASSIGAILSDTAKKAGIKRRIYPHMLRHSFATHLLEKRTDFRYIQELLGYNSTKTIQRYSHVSHRLLKQTKGPIDRIFRNKILFISISIKNEIKIAKVIYRNLF